MCLPVVGAAQPEVRPDLEASISELRELSRSTTRESSVSTTDTRRVRLARRILESDSTNAEALTELGIHHAENYHWYANFIAAKQPIGGGLRGSMSREFHAAYRYLDRAILHDPDTVRAYRELVRLLLQEGALLEAEDLTQRLTNKRPNVSAGWLLRGLVAQRQNRADLAEYLFGRAMAQMDPREAEAFSNTELFLDKDQRATRQAHRLEFDRSFWFSRDPLYLTDENERLVDHYARKVYADLFYGSAETKGWDTERGRVILRYGIPDEDFTVTGAMSRFNVLDFRDFEFVFEDQTRGGHFTLFSPKAGSGSSWTSDYVIQAGEMAAEMPERFRFEEMAATEIRTKVSIFKGPDHQTDVYIQYAVPVAHAGRAGLNVDPRSEIGGFVTSPQGKILTSARTEGASRAQFVGARPYVSGVFEFSLPPGRYGTSVEYLNFDRSAFGVHRDSLDLDPWNEGSLHLSDILLASDIEPVEQSAAPGMLIRGGYRITPDPWSPIEPGADLLIYFELYGLAETTGKPASYRIDARVAPKESKGFVKSLFSVFAGGGSEAVSVSFSGSSTTSSDQRWFAVDLSSQPPGAYQLTVEARDATTGDSDRRTVDLEIGEAAFK